MCDRICASFMAPVDLDIGFQTPNGPRTTTLLLRHHVLSEISVGLIPSPGIRGMNYFFV